MTYGSDNPSYSSDESRVTLTQKERRGFRFLERTHRWFAPVLIAVIWVIFAAGTSYKAAVMLRHGSEHQVSTLSDLAGFAKQELPSKEMIPPFHAFVHSQVISMIRDFQMVFIMTVWFACMHLQNGLILRFWMASAERPADLDRR